MFAEEIGGNATRRRQEEARAKRRQLKQQQQKKAVINTSNAPVSLTTPATPAVVEAVQPIGVVSALEPVADGSKPSAVANALQQRQQRQNVQAQQKACIKIQALYRAHRSNGALLKEQSTLLDQRFQDLTTLTNIIKQKTSTVYVPPPAMATALCRQLLFISKTIPYLRKDNVRYVKLRHTINDAKKVQKMLELVLLPGVFSSDENANPFIVWLQTKEGQLRLELLLRLSLVTATMPNVDQEVLQACTTFLKAVMVPCDSPKVGSTIIQACRRVLLSQVVPKEIDTAAINLAKNKTTQIHSRLGSSLDMILLLRRHLLYATGGEPIPLSSDKLREGCIPSKQRSHADLLFQTVFEAIKETAPSPERNNLMLRFVSEILTVPLLTWKTSDSSTTALLLPDNKTPKKIILVSMIEIFSDHHRDALSMGDVPSTLCSDTALTSCAATTTQCLLANLVQIGRTCVNINGSNVSKFDYESATPFFRFLATLVDAVPLGTFSSRESAVEWVSDGKGHHSPIVLSPVVIQQCKALVSDSFVRKLFHCAIDLKLLKSDETLLQKTEKDLKHEKDLHEAGASATSLAAKEARVDQSRSFWNSSAWARKMTRGVSKMLSGEKKGDVDPKQSGGSLMNTSLVSRALAKSGSSRDSSIGDSSMDASVKDKGDGIRVGYTPSFLLVLCRVYSIILARWGGGGGEDIVKRVHNGASAKKDKNGANIQVAATKADVSTQVLLNLLCFSTSVIKASWGLIQSDDAIIADIYSIIDPARGANPVRTLIARPSYASKSSFDKNDGAALLFIFVTALSHMLIITDDTEMHDMERPLPLHQLRRCIQTLKQLLYRATCIDDVNENVKLESNYFGLALISASSRTMRDLYDRSSRRPLCVPKLWLIQDLMEKEIRRCKTEQDYTELLTTPVLRVCPFLVSFKRRLKLFERIVSTNRIAIQGENSTNPFNSNPLKPGIPVRITRGRILEDGLATMNNLGRNMRQRIQVQYCNEAGARESGIDAGGLFKEFWTDLSAIAFDLNYALFRITDENCMYPNPSSGAAHGTDHLVLFEFLGRILGKALYEGITIHPQFAHFFLSFLRGDYNYFNMLPDLSKMDSQLYNNLMFLKNYDGDAEDLCLTFTVANDDFGGNVEVPLIPNGGNVPVTNGNKQRYIGLVAKYYVVDRVREQSEAFTKGLRDVIDQSWLRIFNEPELQVLISGPSDGKLDVEDMRANCRYAGGYTGIDRNVNRFWNVVASLNSKQQADLLRFVTSCERPPPLGFASMNPPFTIQRVGILRDGDKLPTASTCFNILKLPTYSSEKVLRERLIYAIESGAGFELA